MVDQFHLKVDEMKLDNLKGKYKYSTNTNLQKKFDCI